MIHKTNERTPKVLTLLPKLTYEHINLTSYSKLRADLAAQVQVL